ncbi:unnamed protein product [Dovyalis caffra]|uniref:Uncharacterized protein n=1 Tax=Dovyalis caffra TaxID=77055 RepID=A0AAV1RL59_9ROSI|nr:unnamed protein product [Dovyalis caffra]
MKMVREGWISMSATFTIGKQTKVGDETKTQSIGQNLQSGPIFCGPILILSHSHLMFGCQENVGAKERRKQNSEKVKGSSSLNTENPYVRSDVTVGRDTKRASWVRIMYVGTSWSVTRSSAINARGPRVSAGNPPSFWQLD